MTILPALVYKNGGPHQRPGGFYSYLLVSTEEELKKSLKEGWFLTLPEAIAGVKAVEEPIPDDNAPVTRLELEKKAEELGIKFHSSIGDSNLLKKIEEALGLRG